MRALDEASGGWVSFLSRESEVRYHPKLRQIDYLEKGASVVSGTFELIKSLSYSITTRAEMYDDSVRDGTYQVTVFIYTTGIQLGDKKLQFVREHTQYDRGITHDLYGRPFLIQLSEHSGVPLKESGLDLAPNYLRHPDYQDSGWAPPSKGIIGSFLEFIFGSG